MPANPEIWVYSTYAANQVEELAGLSAKSCITKQFLGKRYSVGTYLKSWLYFCFIVYFQIYPIFKNS